MNGHKTDGTAGINAPALHEQAPRRQFMRLQVGAFCEKSLIAGHEERQRVFSIGKGIWSGSMDGIFEKDINERYRLIINFLDNLKSASGAIHQCPSSGCSASDHYGFEFIDLMKNIYDRKHTEDVSGGQLPGISFLSSTSLSNFSAIFCGNEYKIESRVAREGSFGTASGMRELSHMEEASDFTPMMYMLNHYLHAQHESEHNSAAPFFRISEHVAPFIPCMGDCDPVNDAGRPLGADAAHKEFEKVARFQIDRLNLLKEKIIGAGHAVEENGNGTYAWVFEKAHRFMMVPLVHDVETRKVYAVREKNGAIIKEEFTKFAQGAIFADGAPLLSNGISRKYVENVKKYEANAYATEVIRRRGCCKLECCVDSREGNTAASGVIREIGGYPAENSLRRTIENSSLKMLKIQLHTECGYINLAIGLHKMFRELHSSNGSEATRGAVAGVWADLERIMHGFPVRPYTNGEEIAGQLGLKEGRKLFLSIFAGITSEAENGDRESARLDFRRAMKHMFDRNIIQEGAKGGFCIGAAEKTARNLSANGFSENNLPPEQFAYLVTEQMGRDIQGMAAQMAAQEEEKTGRRVEVEVRIKSLKNKGFYGVGRAFGAADVWNNTRFMFFDISDSGRIEYRVANVFHELGQPA